MIQFNFKKIISEKFNLLLQKVNKIKYANCKIDFNEDIVTVFLWCSQCSQQVKYSYEKESFVDNTHLQHSFNFINNYEKSSIN